MPSTRMWTHISHVGAADAAATMRAFAVERSVPAGAGEQGQRTVRQMQLARLKTRTAPDCCGRAVLRPRDLVPRGPLTFGLRCAGLATLRVAARRALLQSSPGNLMKTFLCALGCVLALSINPVLAQTKARRS